MVVVVVASIIANISVVVAGGMGRTHRAVDVVVGAYTLAHEDGRFNKKEVTVTRQDSTRLPVNTTRRRANAGQYFE